MTSPSSHVEVLRSMTLDTADVQYTDMTNLRGQCNCETIRSYGFPFYSVKVSVRDLRI